jgi:cell division protease FtsH
VRTRQVWILASFVFLVVLVMAVVANGVQRAEQTLPFPDVVRLVDAGRVRTLHAKGSQLKGTLDDGSVFRTTGPENADFYFEKFAGKGIVPSFEEEGDRQLTGFLFNVVVVLLLFALVIVVIRQMQAGSGRAMSFGKSRAKLLSDSGRKVTFEDVAGCEEAKDELQEIIEFLKEPRKFTRLGGRIPKGVLLMGAPGSGKTLLARAVAGEAGVPFFSISGSEFVELFVGVGASRVRDLFEQAKKQAPCIIFVDEIDAVGRRREAGHGGGQEEREQTLNQLLVEMDGFDTVEGIILVAATNRPDMLDPALLRPGRFDRRVVVPAPDVRGRLGILQVHARKTPLGDGVDLERIARSTPGFSGADLENLINEAALLAARHEKARIEMADLEAAKDKVAMGRERRSLLLTEEQRRRTACHEAGHAIVARMVPEANPVSKITIIPRNMALGLTQFLPAEDQYNLSKGQIRAQIAVSMGGRAADELVLGLVDTGAANDLKQATRLAQRYVCDWGMSEELGPITLGERHEEAFLGSTWAHRTIEYSEETARRIDGEVRRLVQEGMDTARQILASNRHILEKVSEALLERETLDGDEFERLVAALGPVPLPATAG